MSRIKVNLLVQPTNVEYLFQHFAPFLTALLHTDLLAYLWLSVKTSFTTYNIPRLRHLRLISFTLPSWKMK